MGTGRGKLYPLCCERGYNAAITKLLQLLVIITQYTQLPDVINTTASPWTIITKLVCMAKWPILIVGALECPDSSKFFIQVAIKTRSDLTYSYLQSIKISSWWVWRSCTYQYSHSGQTVLSWWSSYPSLHGQTLALVLVCLPICLPALAEYLHFGKNKQNGPRLPNRVMVQTWYNIMTNMRLQFYSVHV